MSASIETTDALGSIGRYSGRGYSLDYSFGNQPYVEVGNLSEARAALLGYDLQQAPGFHLSVRYYLKDERLGVVWFDASVDAAPLVDRGTIKMTDDDGAVLFDEGLNQQHFPPTRHGILIGQTVTNIRWSSLQVTVTLSCLPSTAPWLDTLVASSRTMTGKHVRSSHLEPTF